ncbi:MAG TPA: DNA-formamidopyrimidine glycosylase family protein [Acidimicrobiales bacterium]|nr:DNA-formamidopyrimidine glycosylase family protein [Acidimicrobiales bacterium]
MPELPEVQALTAGLADHMAGKRVERCQLTSFSALKTVEPPLEDLIGRTVVTVERRGKFVCIDSGGPWLVVHLARGGWVKWYDALPKGPLRPGRSPIALRVGLEDGSGLDITEMGHEKRLALWVVRAPEDVEPLAALGIDPLGPDFTVDALASLLQGTSATLKTVLTTQSLIAGVGNAYSDEALHRARLSPYKKSGNLDGPEVARLHDAVVGVLSEAVGRAASLGIAELKGDKKRAMQVHGRTGEPCPVCGDTVRQVSFATKSLQYCPTCQTGGKALADRRLSRLLK